VGQSQQGVRQALNFLPFRALCPAISCLLAFVASAAELSELHKQGAALYEQKKYPEAIAALEKAVQTEDPHSVEYVESTLYIGQGYFSLLQPAKAIPWLEKTAATVEVDYMLGNAYLQTRDVDKAEIAFARLFGVPAESAAGHILAAELILKREYRDDALTQAKKALALEPKLAGGHFILGEIAVYHGQLDEAAAEMGKEIEINPNFSMAWYRLGEVLTRQERWLAAIPNLERAIWLNADFSGPFIVLGKCYFKTANYPNAEGILRRALTLDPNNYSARYLLGQTLIAEGKKEEGRAVLEKLKGMEPR
jgi:tetratricopeptide (TPR) repeat protein